MKLDKLKSMLSTDSLHFCRADLLGDLFERAVPKPTIEYRTEFFEGASQHYIEEGIPKEIEKSENIFILTLRLFQGRCAGWH